MADSKKKKMMPKPPQRPNYQIWIIVTLLALILGVTYFNKSNSTIEITQRRFDRMLSEGDVREVVLIDKQNVVEITLSQDALQQPEYSNELEERNPFHLSSGHHYIFLFK